MLCTTELIILMCVSIRFSRRYIIEIFPTRHKFTAINKYGLPAVILFLAFVYTVSYHSICCFCNVLDYELLAGTFQSLECLRNCIQVITYFNKNSENISESFTRGTFSS